MVSETRADLVAVAASLLDEGGVSAVTLREVGRRAGLSHNAPYKHFASKEALLAAVAARELTLRADALAADVGRAAPIDAVRAALRAVIATALAHPERFRLVYGRWTTAAVTDELVVAAGRAHATLVDLVGAAQDARSLPPGDPERMTSLLRALAHGAADLALAGHLVPGGKGNASADDLVDDLLAALAGF